MWCMLPRQLVVFKELTVGYDCKCPFALAVSIAPSRSLKVSLQEGEFKLNSSLISLCLANKSWWVFVNRILSSKSGEQPSETARAYIFLVFSGASQAYSLPNSPTLSLFQTLHPRYYFPSLIPFYMLCYPTSPSPLHHHRRHFFFSVHGLHRFFFFFKLIVQT